MNHKRDIEDTTESNTSALSLNLLPLIERNNQFHTFIYDKCKNLTISIWQNFISLEAILSSFTFAILPHCLYHIPSLLLIWMFYPEINASFLLLSWIRNVVSSLESLLNTFRVLTIYNYTVHIPAVIPTSLHVISSYIKLRQYYDYQTLMYDVTIITTIAPCK